MELEFRTRKFTSKFASPFENFRMVEATGEVRSCPLTGHVCRVLPSRARSFASANLEEAISRSKPKCIFCPEAIPTKATRFPDGIAPDDGRFCIGETTIFPNAFPYDEHNVVAVICREHFLSPGQFGSELLQNAFTACLIYLQRIKEIYPGGQQALLSWNYMPLAGAGLIHPHFHVAALGEPTSFCRSVLARQEQYDPTGEKSLLEDFVEKERKAQERYIAPRGRWHWLTAFAPRGIYEFWAISKDPGGILELNDKDLADLASGFHDVLRFFEFRGIQALNMSWYSLFDPWGKGWRNWMSVIPRVSYPPLGTLDINYFEKLHDESMTSVSPEEVTAEIKKFLP